MLYVNRFGANDSWEIDISEIELVKEIGKGAFGQVWEGKIDSRLLERKSSEVTRPKKRARQPKRSKDKVVAVKMLHGKYQKDDTIYTQT